MRTRTGDGEVRAQHVPRLRLQLQRGLSGREAAGRHLRHRGGTKNPHALTDNVTDGAYPFFAYTPPAVATLTNNTKATVPRVQFRDFMGPTLDENYRKLEWWTDKMTLAPASPQ